ncbi:MAG: tetratricopeptide repeat protein [Sulfuricaulis sp.]|uniref:tetratricopeptide repeat protein n=1 Tax=Sulfuricaulis sp. TaxID=2003553 RepID=UPI0025E7FBE0|nr:tetratricopeptide repeat protein [Sulfuricaulis sp.]MCR4347487.1 tetratricopeptide repeat protein [Sulfuricaulis sp.]
MCAVNMTQDNFEEAMKQLLENVRRDNTFRHQAGRDGLFAIFSLLGKDDERVQRYRTLLNQAMPWIGAVNQLIFSRTFVCAPSPNKTSIY